MRRYYVTLIQDAFDLISFLDPVFNHVILTYFQHIETKDGLVSQNVYIESREAFYRWLICEEILTVHGILVGRHYSGTEMYRQILDLMKNHIDVDQLITQHLYIPRVYNDSIVYVTLNHMDLIIQYDRNFSPLL